MVEKLIEEAREQATCDIPESTQQLLLQLAEVAEKQIPLKPIEDGYYDEPCVCPNCGQALDWGQEE